MDSGAQPQTQRSISADEEALKRNTDCVYYLASPLTCKKGNECEFRHSEIARLNPRDCWFWVNGNCLNPKCGFRHPSLDGVVGAQTPTSSGHSLSQTQTVSKTTPYVPNASGKQVVPCVFFQKGYCLKGDWCPFLHAPSSTSNKTMQAPASASVPEPATIKKDIGLLEKSVQAKKPPSLPVKSVKQVLEPKPAYDVGTSDPRNESFIDRKVQHVSGANEFSGFRNIAPGNGNLVGWSNRVQQSLPLDEPESMNGKEGEEISREPSPGFDVLVDDDAMRESDYYPAEDRYGMSSEHERNEYNIGVHEDCVDIDDDRYQDPLGYDSHERHQDQYAWEQHRASSERISVGSYLERRQHVANDSHVRVHVSDLRHQLSKHMKPNGLRSVISREHTCVMHVQDRLGPHGDRQHVSEHDNALSSRLRGRIRLPENSEARGRVGITSHMGGIQDKRKGMSKDSYSNGWKDKRGPNLRRDDVRDDNEAGFAGPKSLSELKNRKMDEPIRQSSDHQKPLGKRKHSSVIEEGHQQSVDGLNFDGPKSLEEILKRKRGIKSSIVKDSVHGDLDSSADKEVNDCIISSHKNEDAPQSLTTMIEGEHIEDGADLDTEANGTKGERYDYEQTGEEDYEYYDGENGDGVDEYVEDEDDDDDFAKKMGLMQN